MNIYRFMTLVLLFTLGTLLGGGIALAAPTEFSYPVRMRVDFTEISLKRGDVISITSHSTCPENTIPLLGQKLSAENQEKLKIETLPDTSLKVGNGFIIKNCVILDEK